MAFWFDLVAWWFFSFAYVGDGRREGEQVSGRLWRVDLGDNMTAYQSAREICQYLK